jgi:hypothetical protein
LWYLIVSNPLGMIQTPLFPFFHIFQQINQSTIQGTNLRRTEWDSEPSLCFKFELENVRWICWVGLFQWSAHRRRCTQHAWHTQILMILFSNSWNPPNLLLSCCAC